MRKHRSRWNRAFRAAQLACLAVFAYVALFNVSVVRGSSMAPGIHDGDRIVVDHLAYLLGTVERGDIVVLKYPLDPSLDYIKRVIGLPGDEVQIDDGHVYVNGEELTEPYVASSDLLSRTNVRVQPAHYFVLGDNRPRSSDSREFGQVPMDYVRGKVEVRLWPLSRIGTVN
ncbi:MAG TPA: signal peptidase I [Planctomycetota bacterium]|nr:signal peptidase I [Planctomycetota bacterium]